MATVLAALVATLGLVFVPPASDTSSAAGPNQYGPPAWLPLRGNWVVGCTWNNGCDGGYHGYAAIDFARNPTGSVAGDPVHAAGAGLATIVSTGSTCGGAGTPGNGVQIDHGGNIKSYYRHLAGFAISGPTWVDENSVIGYLGHTGYVDPCTFNHLHFEVRNNGALVSPGEMKACHGGQLVTYPAALGRSAWNQVPLWSGAHSDGTACINPPDRDGDGVTDGADRCPDVRGSASNGGCPLVSDFNGDGRTDVAAFYRYDGNVVNLWTWYGQANGSMSAPTAPWTATGWDATRIMPAGTGDFNGDGKADIATFYRHDGGMMDMNVWYGNGSGGLTLSRPWHVDTAWEGARLTSAGAGDFNGDGRTDVAAFYRYDGNVVNLWTWYGQANGSMSAPTAPWTATGWDATRIMPAGTGDFNGDGKADIATFYRHDGGMMDMNVWYGNGSGGLTLSRPWHVDTAWEGTRLTPVT